MQMERQLRAGGGLMTLEEPRQGFFLGKIVKKAKRAVKKIVKSPIGKAAALYALTGGLGALGAGKGIGSLARLSTFAPSSVLGNLGAAFTPGSALSKSFLKPLFFDKAGAFSLGRTALTGLGAAGIAAPFLMGGDEEEEEPDTPFSVTPDSISNIVAQARNQDPTLRFLPKPKFVDNFYAADGGLASLDTPKRGIVDEPGSYAGEKSFLDNFMSAIDQIKSGQVSANLRGDEKKAKEFIVKSGFGTNFDEDQIAKIIDMKNRGMDLDSIATIMEADPNEINNLFNLLEQKAYGGRIGKAEGGIMDLGGMEKDYRTGGFVELGAEERADDVPARLSKNEFVFTADAVRNAGGGDIDKGAEVMQNMMDNLESGGTISEESQGMENPAQAMFDQAQMMEGRLA